MNQIIKKIVYQEEVTSRNNTIGGLVTGVLAIAFLGALIKELVNPIAKYSWAVPLGLFCLFLIISITRLMIRKLKITITTEDITVAFVFARKIVSLDKIDKYSIDKSTSGAYRAQGIYYKTVDGNRSWIYNASNSPKIVIDLKEGEYRRLIFSSNKPDQVASTLADRLKLFH